MFILFNTSSRPVPGWYTDAKSRYDWIWLASRFDRNRDGRVRKAEFDGPEATWAKLDRDGDGAVSADDLDWTDSSLYMKQQAQAQAQARRQLRQLDADGDGEVSAEEWSAAYAKLAAAGKDKKVDAAALRDVLYASAPASAPEAGGFERQSMTAKHRAERLTGILKGDVGSFNEGPDIGDLAPDFTLRTHDGKRAVKLSSLRGRPVVLTFGSFTCPPYRALFPGHEPLRARYGDAVDFLAVYVREAHPTDGWHTAGNGRPVRGEAADEQGGAARRRQQVLRPGEADLPRAGGRDGRQGRPRLQRHAQPALHHRPRRQGRLQVGPRAEGLQDGRARAVSGDAAARSGDAVQRRLDGPPRGEGREVTIGAGAGPVSRPGPDFLNRDGPRSDTLTWGRAAEETPMKKRTAALILILASASFGADDPPAKPRSPARRRGAGLRGALEKNWPDHPEWVAMLTDILQGSQLGPTDGWFKKAVSQTGYGWEATRSRLDKDGDGRISPRRVRRPEPATSPGSTAIATAPSRRPTSTSRPMPSPPRRA